MILDPTNFATNFKTFLLGAIFLIQNKFQEATNCKYTSGDNNTAISTIDKKNSNYAVVANITADMFDEPFTQMKLVRSKSVESNDSFEIPETQPDPQRNGRLNEDIDSEDFIAIPDEDLATYNECHSQSQDLLCGVSLLDSQLNVTPTDDVEEKVLAVNHISKLSTDLNLEDHDSTDLEMSKLEWTDTTKEGDNSKSASVTPELDFDHLLPTKSAIDLLTDAPNLVLNSKRVSHDCTAFASKFVNF